MKILTMSVSLLLFPDFQWNQQGFVYPTVLGATLLLTVVLSRLWFERRHTEKALKESESLFRGLAESTQAGILIYQNGQITYVNPAIETITGYRNDELINRNLLEFLRPDFRDLIAKEWRARARGGSVSTHYEVVLLTKTGEERTVDWTAGFTELNGKPTTIVTLFDITEHILAEAAYRLSEERFSTAFHGCGTALCIVSTHDQRIIEANDAWFEITGLTREGAIGHTREEIGIGISGIQPEELLNTVASGVTVRDVELTLHFGEKREMDLLIFGLPLKMNQQLCSLWGLQDITPLKRTEAELRSSREQLRRLAARLQAAREEERTSVAREIHDELGGALTGLKLEIRRLDDLLSEAPRAAREKIASLLDLVGSIINTVRRIATSLRPGVLDDFGLAAALEWQAQEFTSRAGIECTLISKPQNMEDMWLDRDLATAVFRIFQEALTNIIRHAAATKVVVSLTQTNEQLLLEVRDNGRGITPGELNSVRSLGLLGMRERAQMFGGICDIHGNPGQGTIVTLSLPIGSPHAGSML